MSATEGLVSPFGYGLAYQDWIDVAAPAAGNVQTFSVDGAWFLRIIAARATITTDANVANRVVSLDFLNARGITYVSNGAPVLVTASTTAQVFEWDHNRTVSEWNTGTTVWAPCQDEFLPPGFVVKWNVANIQVGDTLTALRLWVEKFPTGARGFPQGMVPSPRLAAQYG